MKLQSFALYLLFHCITSAVASSESVDCENTPYGSSCTLPSAPGRTALINNRLFVGVVDELISFELGGLQLSDQVNLNSSQQRRDTCVEGTNPLNDCRNFIRVIQPLPESAVAEHGAVYRILVCGTNSHFPKCTLHNPANLSDWVYMTPSEQNDRGFVPYSNSRPNVGVLATNGRYYSGTFFFEYIATRTIGMAPNPLQKDSTFTVETLNGDFQWLNKPDFVSAYEIGDHIYFFVTERASEMEREVVYSRAIRVCKDDAGLPQSSQSAIFSTFHKARMRCTYSGEGTTIPYDYDTLKATFLLNSNDEYILYGAFSSPTNGPEGAAICKFTFDETSGSLTQVFDEGRYYFQDDSDEWVEISTEPFSCPGTNRSTQHVRDYQLVFNPATPLEPQPLHLISGSEFTQIAVDVVNYNGEEQEILYFSLANGEIRQYVISGGEGYEHTIYDTDTTVHDLVLNKDSDSETRFICATTDDNVMSIPLGDCARYTGCFECMDSKDPYCGWDQDRDHCANKFGPTISLIESCSSTEESIIAACGERPSEPPTEPTIHPTCAGSTTSSSSSTLIDPTGTSADSTNVPQSTETEVAVQCTTSGSNQQSANTPRPTVTGNVGGLEDSEGSGDISIPELIGATAGGFLLGVPVGLIICAFFYNYIRKRREPKPNRTSEDLETSSASVVTVNNQLEMNAHKKEQSLQRNQNHYIDAPVPKVAPHTPPEKRNINEYEAEEGEDDVLTDLPPSTAFHGPTNGITPGPGHRAVTTGNPRVLHRPVYSAQRSRTESTKRLMSSISSEPSDSPGNSPLDSPV